MPPTARLQFITPALEGQLFIGFKKPPTGFNRDAHKLCPIQAVWGKD